MTEPMKYRKKPVVIEAMQWDGTAEGATLIVDWVLISGGSARYDCNSESRERTGDPMDHWIVIETLEGPMRLTPHAWAARGVKGEFYPIKPDIFEATYEAVSETSDAQEEALLRYPPCEPFLNDDGIWDQVDDWGFSEAQRQAFLAGVAWAEGEGLA